MDTLKGPPKLIAAIGAGLWLTLRAASGMARRILAGDTLAQRQLAQALPVHVWRPLRTLLPLAALAGAIAGTGAARLLALYNAQIPVLTALAAVLLRDIAPLLVGLFACGSVSVALAARLGAMALNREIDALEALGRDPVAHALGPSLAAVLLSIPIHMALAGIAAVIGCGVPLGLIANITWPLWVGYALSHDAAQALLTGMGKLLLYALIAFAVGSAVGAKPVRSPTDIGRRAITAFTAGLLGIFAAAAIWTGLA